MMQKRQNDTLVIFRTSLFGLYMFMLIHIIIFKMNLGFQLPAMSERVLNAVPLAETLQMLADPSVSLTTALINVLGNIALFVPIGLYIPTLTKRYFSVTLAAGLSISLLLETLQYVLVIGVSDIDDVIFNVLGAMLGACIYWAYSKLYKNKNRRITAVMTAWLAAGCAGLILVTMMI